MSHADEATVGEQSVRHEHPAITGHDDAARLREPADGEPGALVTSDLQQHGRRELAGLESRLEREDSVGGELVHVEGRGLLVERDVVDRREPSSDV